MSDKRVESNKVVSITYTIRDEQDNMLEAVEIPVDYLHGSGSLIGGIEQALSGLAEGERVDVTVPPEHGFGPWDPSLSFSDVIENVPPEYRRLGAEAEFHNEDGEVLTMRVTHVDRGTVTLDGNHPLAGKTLIFAVTIKGIRDATADELRNGVAPPQLH